MLEGARLVTETVPGRARCLPCADEWAVGMPPDLCCPACGTAAAELLSTLQGELDQRVSDVRTLSHSLLPPVLDELGLSAALAEIVYESPVAPAMFAPSLCQR